MFSDLVHLAWDSTAENSAIAARLDMARGVYHKADGKSGV